MLRTLLVALATIVAVSAWLPHSARGQQVIEIDASALGGTEARPSDMNNAGQLVGSFVASNGVRHAFVWTDGVMLDIETDPNAQSFALGINDHGVVVGQTTDTDGDTIAFRWSAQTHMVRVTVFDGASIAGRESTALDINNNDVMVGYARAQSPFGLLDRAFRMTGFGSGQQIGGLTLFISRAFAINDFDQIVGQADATNFVTVATFWDPLAIQLDTATGSASDINDAGRAVGRAFTGSTDRGRLWRLDPNGPPIETALNPLPLPGHTTSAASGIRNEASTNGPLEIVGRSSSSSEFRAVRWLVDAIGTPTVEDLNGLLPDGSGWFLRTASAINDRGQIVGTGTLGDSEIRAYLYDPNEAGPPTEEPPAVLFMHGILANQMYLGDDRKVWLPEPTIPDFDLTLLTLTEDGQRVFGITPKEEDVLLTDTKTVDIYKSFVNFMDGLRDAGRLSDWYAYTYDWRLDYNDILDDGSAYRSECVGVFGKTCEQCTEDLGAGACVRPEAKILELAKPSEGVQRKVWVIAHSNGGLLFKTLLSRRPDLRDLLAGLILVGSPQLGTPQTFPPTLHGEEFNILMWLGRKSSTQEASRTAGRTWPMSYLLLPSRTYFARVATPVLTFDPTSPLGFLGETNPSITAWNALYPGGISTFADMESFLLGSARPQPPESDLNTPNVIDPDLFAEAELAHQNIDGFDPDDFLDPLPVYQIVGWGLETTRGIGYRPTVFGNIGRELLYTCDGDGTVVLPSAQALSNATTFYIDFPAYNRYFTINRRHKNMLEPDPVQELVARIIEGKDPTGIDYISRTKPTKDCDGVRLRTRSPAEIHVFQDGLHTGPAEQDPNSATIVIDDEIPNSRYKSLGEGREAIVDGVDTYEVVVEATGVGTVTLEADRFLGDVDEELMYVPLIPILKGSTISFLLDPNSDMPPELVMDIDGDGTPDFILPTDGTIPDPDLYLDVLISAVEQLSADTREAKLKRATRFVLRYVFLRHTLRLLEKAESDLVRKPRRVERRLKLARGTLRLYTLVLEHAVRSGRASEEAAQPLLEQADAIRELIATLIEQLP